MSHPELEELERAEQFFNEGKLDEALGIFNNLNQLEGLNLKKKNYYQFLKGLILFYQYKSEELIKLGEEIFKEGQKLNENLHSFDGLFFILMGLGLENKFEEGFNRIGQAETLLEHISNEPKNVIIQRKVRLSALKGFFHLYAGKLDVAEESLEESLRLQDELYITWEGVWANLIMSYIKLFMRGRSDLAMENTKKAMSLAEKISFNHYWLGYCHIDFGGIHLHNCEYDLSFEHYMKSLALFKQINNKWFVAILLNNLGNLSYVKGEYVTALKHLEEAIILWEPYPLLKDACLDSLILVSLEAGDTERAQKYFQRLEDIYNLNKKDHLIEGLYRYNKALLLKRSSRIRDKAKAEELLKQVIGTEDLNFETTNQAHIHLCDLLLTEFRINNDNEVLNEINHYIAKLLTIAEKQHSYLVFCETFILQAKLALLNFNIKAARRFLTQAQKIAESYGIKRLAMKISHEHDELLRQIKIWEKLKESEAPLTERWKLAGLNEQMENLVKKRMVAVPDLKNEEAVLLLIVSEGGIPFFSHAFTEDKSFESHLFGGFLTTIDYFIKETFSEGLDRAIFGEYTLLMKSIPPFFVSYIFKGDSYYAIQKLDYFINHIQKEEDIWQNFLKSFQLNQTIHLSDIPVLDSLITEIFISKSIVTNQI